MKNLQSEIKKLGKWKFWLEKKKTEEREEQVMENRQYSKIEIAILINKQ